MRVVDNNVVFVPGLTDLDDVGVVKNPDNLASQISAIVTRLEHYLERAESRLNDLVKLVVYYVQDGVDETQLRLHVGQCLGSGVETAVTLVPLRKMRHSGALVEIEAVAIRGGYPREIANHGDLADLGPGFCHGLTCGEFSFLSGQSAASRQQTILYPGDLVSQNRQTIENLQAVMQDLGINGDNIVKVNSWRAPVSDTTAYEQAATDRFRFLAAAGPAVTGITIPRLDAIGYQIRLDLWAMDPKLPRTQINPPNHWGWKIAASYSHGLQVGSWLFVGGQGALDQNCTVQYPGDTSKQVEITRDFIESVLRHAGGEYNIVKLTGLFCCPGESEPGQQIVQSIQDQFRNYQLASSLVPVDHLAYPHQAVELDAIATLKTT